MKAVKSAAKWDAKEIDRAEGGQTIYYIIIIKKGEQKYRHYLYCPMCSEMVQIKEQTSAEISPPSILDEAIQEFKMLLDNKKGPH